MDFFMINFDDFKINCSQIGNLMAVAKDNTPPTAAQLRTLFGTLSKNYKELSESQKLTAKDIMLRQIFHDPKKPAGKILSEMIMIYAYEVYGKSKISKGNDSPKEMDKGLAAEPAAIEFLSKFDGVEYSKNEEIFENKYFKGIPDVLVRDESGKIIKVIDIKVSYDLPSFILNKVKGEEKQSNALQVMGYMDLTKCKKAEIVHILVDMPESIAKMEEKRLKERYASLELSDDEINNKISTVLNSMNYSDIPEEFRIFRRSYSINNISLKAIKQRITYSKNWIKNIHNVFTNNSVNLLQKELENQESNI